MLINTVTIVNNAVTKESEENLRLQGSCIVAKSNKFSLSLSELAERKIYA